MKLVNSLKCEYKWCLEHCCLVKWSGCNHPGSKTTILVSSSVVKLISTVCVTLQRPFVVTCCCNWYILLTPRSIWKSCNISTLPLAASLNLCFICLASTWTSIRPSWKGYSVRSPRQQRRRASRRRPSWRWSPQRKRSEKGRFPTLSGGTRSSCPPT